MLCINTLTNITAVSILVVLGIAGSTKIVEINQQMVVLER